jgi:putative DNA primase/helicase
MIHVINPLQHDGTLDIAVGRSRRETNWKNKEMTWSALLERLVKTHYTAETHSEYLSAKKIRQDEIKDIGGFVGGYLSSGRRKAASVVHRRLLTLDLDFAEAGSWEDFKLLYGNAAAIYSTHKHSPELPRLRLLIPLDRDVARDEYVAIARRVAGELDIEVFDPTTYQPERLMYWPSTSKDGEYEFNYQDGPWLCADRVLASYRDWRDSSEWPMSERESSIPLRAIKKQGDPLEKPGVIGAFCRTYTIAEAIDKFLQDVYEPCDTDGRYSFKEGSTAAGLVIYEDKYAYSHHGTDPISGKLCNAFDLVRLHKYGLKDEDAREDTPGNKMPSYTEMIEFAMKDPEVRKTVGAEKFAETKGDFTEFLEVEVIEQENTDWTAELDMDKKGHYYSTVNNVVLILKNDPKLKDRFALDAFEHREIALKNLPWRKVTKETRCLTDKDDAALRYYIEKNYGISGIQKINDGFSVLLIDKTFHPVRDYLDSLEWDGEERVASLFIDYLGAADIEYTRAVTLKALVAAVARIFEPGTKFDNLLTLVGPQGIGKSTLLRKLGQAWFSDSFSFHMIGKKESIEQLQGVWIVEIGELAGMKNAELESVKHFMSKTDDRYRVAFGKRVENFPRQCVFFPSSNNRDFLRDYTGNRRFWPVDMYETKPVKSVFTDLDSEVNNLWAEAVYLYKHGESLHLSDELEKQAYDVQGEHREQDERTGIIQRYLDTLLPDNWKDLNVYDRRSFLQGEGLQKEGTVKREKVCAAEIWCEALNGVHKEMSSFNTKFIHDIMRTMKGWEIIKNKTRFGTYGMLKGYHRVNHSAATIGKNVAAAENLM